MKKKYHLCLTPAGFYYNFNSPKILFIIKCNKGSLIIKNLFKIIFHSCENFIVQENIQILLSGEQTKSLKANLCSFGLGLFFVWTCYTRFILDTIHFDLKHHQYILYISFTLIKYNKILFTI